ncbi:oxaloacetate decarboxylase [Streptomyces sp. cg36]|uniref:isocitrate lyase/PEP mutase family protein n=1 Tax=Streptomyces sp. cg36 TaxID=3238798 RepID=UPI0034E1B29F
MKNTTKFKQLLHSPEILVIPVAHDPLGARIVEQTGFSAVGCAGYATSAALLGAPDIGLLTLTEMADAVARMADAVDLPVWADGDNGHGNTINVRRTVRLMERAGAASLMLEDQVSPKRCGHMAGKSVVPVAEFISKIKAAVDARDDEDFTILARTDALAVGGVSAAVDRAARAVEAGADWVFVEAPRDLDQLRRIPRLFEAPTLANMIPGGATPLLPAADLQQMGYAAVVWPTAFTYTYAAAVAATAKELRGTGMVMPDPDTMVSFDEFSDVVGLSGIRATERLDTTDEGRSQDS